MATPGRVAPGLDSPVEALDRGTARGVVIIPTYNERENIERLVRSILQEQPELDVLIMDDGSPDGTGEIADGLAREDARVSVVHRACKEGLAGAYLAGFRRVLERPYQFVLQMDADFSHRVEDLPRLLEAAETADVVIGSRSVSGGQGGDRSLSRRLISQLGGLYARVMLGIPIRDCTGGFKCFRRRALLAIDLGAVRSKGYSFQVEMNHLCHRAGLHLVEVPIVFPDRVAGHSKMTWQIFVEAWVMVFRLRARTLGLRHADAVDPAPGVPAP